MPCEHSTYRYGKRILTQCECFCDLCWTTECVCKACNHDVKIPLHPGYFAAKVVVEHKCAECGVEIVRTGTRGRWPTKCSACKELAT